MGIVSQSGFTIMTSAYCEQNGENQWQWKITN